MGGGVVCERGRRKKIVGEVKGGKVEDSGGGERGKGEWEGEKDMKIGISWEGKEGKNDMKGEKKDTLAKR